MFCLFIFREENNSYSSILEAAIIIGFIILILFSLVLFLKITKFIRSRREKNRIKLALSSTMKLTDNNSSGGKNDKRGNRNKIKNAFMEIEWEGVPA